MVKTVTKKPESFPFKTFGG